MSIINKIKLFNFKRFESYVIEPNSDINILVGDNEVGKSSILEAIDLVSSGSVRRVESIGLDHLLNVSAVKRFLNGPKTFNRLPILKIELYLSGSDFDFTMNGTNNTDQKECDGIRLVCEPNPDYITEIKQSLSAQQEYFPYDYYRIRFSTFANEGYSGYEKKLRSILIDSTKMNSEYAITDFVKRTYLQYTESDVKERAMHKGQYRQLRNAFQKNSLSTLNERVPDNKKYTFGLKSGGAMNLESDLMIYEDDIPLDNKGTGRQVFIKTDFALNRKSDNLDVILIEEPETHLSVLNLRKLIKLVENKESEQIFLTTHNSLISTRLELNNLLIMYSEEGSSPVMLHDISLETAKYFMKAPPANIIEFSLSRKAILVEGPSEYMLLESFYKIHTNHLPEDDNVHIIDIRGLSFKRYLEIATLTKAKVAVLTDNDSDYQKNCINKYADFASYSNIKIFFETDVSKRTFEIVLFSENNDLCKNIFGENAQDYMLSNKTEAAYTLLTQNETIVVPDYIKRAFDWIRK